MKSERDRDSYWTHAEAITWMCTRQLRALSTVEDPRAPLALNSQSQEALNELAKRCRDGLIRSVGRRRLWPDEFLKYSMNLVDQTRWLNAGRPSDTFESIQPCQWIDLEWATTDGKLTGGLRSKYRKRAEWVMVQFSRSDLIREWPVEASARPAAAPRRGPKPKKSDQAKKKMRDDISQHGVPYLRDMLEKELPAAYGVGRTTARAARADVLSELGAISNSDK